MGDDESHREYSEHNDVSMSTSMGRSMNPDSTRHSSEGMDKSLGASIGGSQATRGTQGSKVDEEKDDEGGPPVPALTARAKRRREEAVRRLVADIQSKLDPKFQGDTSLKTSPEAHEWLVASTVATALEKGLDRDLRADLEQEKKDNAIRIGQICHDHSEVFLKSVAQVAALGTPSADLAKGLQVAQSELEDNTIGKMSKAANLWENARAAHTRAKALYIMVHACQKVAQYLEKARKQATLGRPRAALDAVDQARQALTSPMASLFYGSNIDHEVLFYDADAGAQYGGQHHSIESQTAKKLARLEETPFGRRATSMLPKIENEVLMNARRQLNRWFLSLRSGEGVKCGRSVLRRCSHSIATGPGQLGLGGIVPPSYLWRSKTADNLIARVNQAGRVARAARQGYWFERDAHAEAKRLSTGTETGIDRRAEAFATAFGYYRCWEDAGPLLVDILEIGSDDGGGSRSAGLSGSRHGPGRGGGRGGRGMARGFSRGGRSLGFQAQSGRATGTIRNLTMLDGVKKSAENNRAKWAQLLVPEILFGGCTTKKDDDARYLGLPESVHPVRRAEIAYGLLGKSEEFVAYYEQNRFGDTRISGDTGSGNKEDDLAAVGGPSASDDTATRSCLSSLTGEDVSVGTTRMFFFNKLPNLCASVLGFCAVEAALESGTFLDDDNFDLSADKEKSGGKNGKSGGMNGGAKGSKGDSSKSKHKEKNAILMQHAGQFREASERYERSLISELGTLYRSRALNANMPELVRSTCLMSSFRSALRLVHPASSTRRSDKELLALRRSDKELDIKMVALKVARDEQLKVTKNIVNDDRKQPMAVKPGSTLHASIQENSEALSNAFSDNPSIPEAEELGLPFGLSKMKVLPPKGSDTISTRNVTAKANRKQEDKYTFSSGVPIIIRSVHARAIAIACFALSLEELGEQFPEKKKGGSPSAGYVLDCVENCINVAAMGMKDSESVQEEGSIEKAVQVMANILALQNALPRLFGTLMRGMTIVGLIRSDEIQDTFNYAEKTLKNSNTTCDTHITSVYSLVFEICRSKIDSHLNYSLENFSWVTKIQRDTPNAYCEGMIGYLQMVFSALGPMDDGSKTGLKYSCMGHLSDRLVKLLAGKPNDPVVLQATGLAPISKIDAFGIKNLQLDVQEFQKFADSTGIPGLRDQFNELECLTTAMLDKNLPILLQPGNVNPRRERYKYLSMEKVANILEKYVGTGFGERFMGGQGQGPTDLLLIDNREVATLLRVVRAQIIA